MLGSRLSRFYSEAKILATGESSSAIQRTVIAQHVLA